MLNFLKKLFMRNPKHYIVSGPSVPEKDFTNKRNARKFLFQNSENGYDAMIDYRSLLQIIKNPHSHKGSDFILKIQDLFYFIFTILNI